jgi:hypothetical protein
MRKLLYSQRLMLACVGATSLTLTACGGGTDSNEPLALSQQLPAQVSGDVETAVPSDTSGFEELLAADAGAATRELR